MRPRRGLCRRIWRPCGTGCGGIMRSRLRGFSRSAIRELIGAYPAAACRSVSCMRWRRRESRLRRARSPPGSPPPCCPASRRGGRCCGSRRGMTSIRRACAPSALIRPGSCSPSRATMPVCSPRWKRRCGRAGSARWWARSAGSTASPPAGCSSHASATALPASRSAVFRTAARPAWPRRRQPRSRPAGALPPCRAPRQT